MKKLVVASEKLENIISLDFSADIVQFLRQDLGYTLKKIGELIGLSESYISRVRKGERSFTVKHLVRLEKTLKKPLPLLLIEAIPKDSLDTKMQALYRSLHKNLNTNINRME